MICSKWTEYAKKKKKMSVDFLNYLPTPSLSVSMSESKKTHTCLNRKKNSGELTPEYVTGIIAPSGTLAQLIPIPPANTVLFLLNSAIKGHTRSLSNILGGMCCLKAARVQRSKY